MAVNPPTVHHTLENGKTTIEGIIDPALVDQSQATNTDSANSNETESAKLPDDEKVLKRTWLTLLPTEQVIEILMKLDECVVDGHEVKREVWPTDMKAAVFHAAVTRIVESSGSATATGSEGTKGGAGEVTKSVSTTGVGKKDVTKDPSPPTTSIAPTSTPGLIASTPSTTPVPPLTSTVLRTSPPTSTTTYQAAASASSTSFSYPYAPYSSGSISYNHHSSHHLPYSFSYSPNTSSSSIHPSRVPPPSTPLPPLGEEEDDLPSYEEMLVQALSVHHDPGGTAPKQLFQWMAATYPLQANFRPSASQALQKAYKRGRFEKNNEGKYRLNPCWVGGNTSRRTTRRPQTYAKAVLNPSPSSHPPPNPSHYPPQHYKWTYGTKSQSPAPPTPSLAPTTASAGTVSETTSSVGGKQPQLTANAVGTGESDQDHESHRSCMEAAYSILQALNITGSGASSLINASSSDSTKVSNVPARDTVEPGEASGLMVPGTSVSSESLQPTPSSSAPYTTTIQPNRAALQGSLALLAAQLAELADDASSSYSQSTATIGLASLNFFEGLGMNLNLDLAQLGLEVEFSNQ